MPDQVATHFDANGHPNGWMSRAADLLFTALLGGGLPLFISGICFAIRFLPPVMINLPRRDYWLAPERRAETSDYIFRQSLWFGCLMVCFVGGIHLLVVAANQRSSPQLSNGLL